MRFATDTGGTFTDLILEDDDGGIRMYKASTTPADPVKGVLDALQKAADDYALNLEQLLAKGDSFIHGTTHALNAIVTGKTAKTAFITTAGHRDILTLREGGREDMFNHTVPFPSPYVPRALVFEAPERIAADGSVITALDEAATVAIIEQLKTLEIEAVGVCLLWSISNPAHELRIAELLQSHLPGVPNTLSHRLNPSIREYRRASSTCIDASLKPMMTNYLSSLTGRLRDSGFSGRVLMLTSGGGMLDAEGVANAPIHAVNSGPSMAPVAGRFYGSIDAKAKDETDNTQHGNIIVADTGGTTYDVSLVRNGRIPISRELWIGQPYQGHMTGFPSIEVKSVGAGGGSIAWVDAGGLLHVGPQSAGSVPGPVCYSRGGEQPTVTDASVVLGYLDTDNFLGGAMPLDAKAARRAVQETIAEPLALSIEDAAAAILTMATENMVGAIADITIKQGVDPAQSVLIGGGGAAGLNTAWIAKRLGCPLAIIPETGPALSAAGALMSDLSAEYSAVRFTASADFDYAGINDTLGQLLDQCQRFIAGPGANALSSRIEVVAQARYKNQVWEIDLPVPLERFGDADDVARLVADFHDNHEAIFAVRDLDSPVEFVSWSAAVHCRLRQQQAIRLAPSAGDSNNFSGSTSNSAAASRRVYFQEQGSGEQGFVDTPVYSFNQLDEGATRSGPAIVESAFTTVVVPPDFKFGGGKAGNLKIVPPGADQ